ncbi:MAG: HD domain-containing protein [Proteobacteria bacterium]|nr:HD domain-containing protein [Pseudomonadota bacterium]
MKPIFNEIWTLAEPYLRTRDNQIHTEITQAFAYKLLEKEGGDEAIVIPAIILHDVGWMRVPEHLHLKAFGPKAMSRELNRVHEFEGARLAKQILETVGYDGSAVTEIVNIIEGHDSRKEGLSLNDKIVKDADKLWRSSKEGFHIDARRFELTPKECLDRLRSHLDTWYLTDAAKEMARQELLARGRDTAASHGH